MQQQREVMRSSWKWLAGVLGGLVLVTWYSGQTIHANMGEEAVFPVPEALRPNIAFWKRIFGVLDTRSGVLHDMDDVTIIYHTFRDLPESPQERQNMVDLYREQYKRILETLAEGNWSDLDSDEKRVLALFKHKQSPAAFQVAAENMRFQLGIRDRFAEGLLRSVDYLSEMEPIFEASGLPHELVLLPHVESSFNRQAYSKAGAAGIWQFTAGTGRRFMRIDHRVDERLDVRLSTIAATKLLRENYEKLGTWPLAITAYNHGAAGMQRAVDAVGTTDFGTIVERYRGPLFGFASRNFYAEFLAAVEVTRHYRQYFPELTLARSPYVRMAEHVEPRRDTPLVQTVGTVPQPRREYRVQPGDTLWSIAQHFDTSPATLAALNGFPAQEGVRTGQVLTLPAMWPQEKARAYMASREVPVQSARVAPAPAPVSPVPPRPAPVAPVSPPVAPRVVTHTYQVRPGETLTGIARRFATTASALAALNGLKPPLRVKTGQTLTVPDSAGQAVVAKNLAPKVVAVAPVAPTRPPVAKSGKKEPQAVAKATAPKTVPENARRPAGTPATLAPATRRVVAKTYKVRTGDTLIGIAQRFGTTVPALLALNGLKKPVIKPGQVLTLPPATQGTVAREAGLEPLGVLAG